MTRLQAVTLLRAANVLLYLLWLDRIRAGGLLVSLGVPSAVFCAYVVANVALAWLRREIRPAHEAGLLVGDLALLTWATAWCHAWTAEFHLASLIPVVLAVNRLHPGAAAGITAAALAASFGLASRAPGPIPQELPFRLAVLALVPWAVWMLAAQARQSENAEAAPRKAPHRSLLFNEFLSHILFQMREYLTSITTVSAHLERTTADPGGKGPAAKLRRMIGELNEKIARMFATIESHTTMLRPATRPEFQLEPLLRECLKTASAACPIRSVKTRIWCDPQMGALQGERDAVAAIVTAVLENALEAFAESGRGAAGGGSLAVSARRRGDYAEIEIVDDAGGIPPADIMRALQPLFTTKSARGGLGLGLPMSLRMLERMGGSLRLRSEGGRTLVRLEIPVRPLLPQIRNEDSTWAARRDQY
ncbi:MAG: HAMP domain-containing sensor histidine kinase [Elusimicrobiota bacterium]